MNRIIHVVGARPNFMKAAPVLAAIRRQIGCEQILVHTGQHYDANMSDVFFSQLGLPEPDVNLSVGSGSHAEQTAEVMKRFETVVLDRQPDMVLVYGDVNSTVAAALVCAKLQVRVGHVEAGLRSFDRSMPEEINRLLTDQLADPLFTSSPEAETNLRREGVEERKIHFVGNVMIDTLVSLLPKTEQPPAFVPERPYALVTLHRPGNVDDFEWLKAFMTVLESLSREILVIFPVHPRTRERLSRLGLLIESGEMRFTDPLSYLEFVAVQRRASVVITDSGGVQEETTYLGIPCLTLRENTERPVTVTMGTNRLIGRDTDRLRAELERIRAKDHRTTTVPPLWDGHAAERIADVLATL